MVNPWDSPKRNVSIMSAARPGGVGSGGPLGRNSTPVVLGGWSDGNSGLVSEFFLGVVLSGEGYSPITTGIPVRLL